jgi:hypothetical protein
MISHAIHNLREKQSFSYLVLQLLKSAPPAHHERIIGSYDGDHINALGLELIVLLYVRREMVDMTGGLFVDDDIMIHGACQH